MAIKTEFKIEDGYIRVIASGRDEGLSSVLKYNASILQKALIFRIPRILCDERNLQYALKTFENYELASHAARIIPKSAKIAIVTIPEQIADLDFWETVAVNRGLLVKTFTDIDKAEKWLISDEH